MAYQPQFPYEGRQIIIDSGRVTLNSKDDTTFLLGREAVSISSGGTVNIDSNGDFLLKLSKLKNVRQMFAFEPQKKAFVILKKKLSKQNCLFFKTALDEKPRYKDMFINKIWSDKHFAGHS